MAGELSRISNPSLASAPLSETDRIPCQKKNGAVAIGDICQLTGAGWGKTATAAPALRMAIMVNETSVTLGNPGVRIRYTAETAITPGTLFYLDAAASGGLNPTVNGSPLARALANSNGVFEGVLELL